MHLLILGYSSIVRRRVLPAAKRVSAISRITVASRRGAASDGAAGVEWSPDYDRAIASAGADLCYVSGVNMAHAEWASRALDHGLHVMVDKPAFSDLETTERIARLARTRKRGLAEATVFGFHPQVQTLRTLIQDSTAQATMTFTIPPLPAGDFRYRADCGGGSLNDLGPYVVATNRLLFGTAPAAVFCAATRQASSQADVDTSFSVLLAHENGGALAAHCGFETVYQNRLSLVTRTRAIDAERIFSTPPDFAPTLKVVESDVPRPVSVPAADTFALFLSAFCDAIDRDDFTAFESALLDDARLLDRLRQAAARA